VIAPLSFSGVQYNHWCERHRSSGDVAFAEGKTQKARRVAGFLAQSYCSNIAVHNKNEFVKR
jgi:hypothetical protein